jgi:hypothetical protein
LTLTIQGGANPGSSVGSSASPPNSLTFAAAKSGTLKKTKIPGVGSFPCKPALIDGVWNQPRSGSHEMKIPTEQLTQESPSLSGIACPNLDLNSLGSPPRSSIVEDSSLCLEEE